MKPTDRTLERISDLLDQERAESFYLGKRDALGSAIIELQHLFRETDNKDKQDGIALALQALRTRHTVATDLFNKVTN
jgi:hypothetical protein